MIQSSAVAAATPAWQGRAIATSRLRLMEFSAYVQQRGEENNYQRHLFVHIASPLSYRLVSFLPYCLFTLLPKYRGARSTFVLKTLLLKVGFFRN